MDSLGEVIELFWFLVFKCFFFDHNRFNLFALLDLPDSSVFGLGLLIFLTLGVDDNEKVSDCFEVHCLASTFNLEVDCLASTLDVEVDWANLLLSNSGSVEI